MHSVVAIVPAVLGGAGPNGARLLEDILGAPVFAHIAARVALVARLAHLVVATTLHASDDPVDAACRARGIACFRADVEADNALGLVLAALKATSAKAGVIVRSDSPLIDPAIVDRVVTLVEMTDGMVDFVGNTLARTCPRGMEVEAVTAAALEDADRRCADPADRRDPTLYLRRSSRLYRLLGVAAEGDLVRPDLDLSCEMDSETVTTVLRHFAGRTDFSLREIIACLDART